MPFQSSYARRHDVRAYNRGPGIVEAEQDIKMKTSKRVKGTRSPIENRASTIKSDRLLVLNILNYALSD